MSRKGNCWDNAPTESFFNSVKNERVHATRYRTHQDTKADLFEYIEIFCNRSRRHSSLGFVSPEQFLRDWIKAQQVRCACITRDRWKAKNRGKLTDDIVAIWCVDDDCWLYLRFDVARKFSLGNAIQMAEQSIYTSTLGRTSFVSSSIVFHL